jgi:tripartite-type tricarboxylate transporter receptor subunit TctC
MRRLIDLLCIAAAVACALATPAQAQDFPSRPIRLLVGFAPGGTTDFDARLIADKVKDILKQSVVVENKPGANGAIAAESVARAEPDGHTLFFTNMGAVAVNPSLRANLAYNPTADFAPIALLVRNTVLLTVRTVSPANDARDFAAMSKTKPGGATIGITGVGAMTHLTLALFQSAADTRFQAVPYRGAAQALNALLGGQIDAMFGEFPVLLPQLKSGTIKALAASSLQRPDTAPQVATFVEQGFGDVVAENWSGVVAPARTPPAVIARLNAAFVAAVNDPEIRQKLVQSGVTPWPSTPEEFAKTMREESARWAKVIGEKGIKADGGEQ